MKYVQDEARCIPNDLLFDTNKNGSIRRKTAWLVLIVHRWAPLINYRVLTDPVVLEGVPPAQSVLNTAGGVVTLPVFIACTMSFNLASEKCAKICVRGIVKPREAF